MKSKHTHFWCLNFHFFLFPLFEVSLLLGVHFGSNTPSRPCQARVIYTSSSLLPSPMWDMSCKFMHRKSYFSNRECVILFTCTTILILPNQDLGIFLYWSPTHKSISIGLHCYAFSNQFLLPLTSGFFTLEEKPFFLTNELSTRCRFQLHSNYKFKCLNQKKYKLNY